MKPLIVVWGMVAIVVAGGLLLGGCGSQGATVDPRAQQLQAEAELARAEGEAERDLAAADEVRAATRQMERDAAHARSMEMIMFVLVAIGGAILLTVLLFLGVAWWQGRPAPVTVTATPALPAPPSITVFILPEPREGQSRGDYWRQVEAAAGGRVFGEIVAGPGVRVIGDGK